VAVSDAEAALPKDVAVAPKVDAGRVVAVGAVKELVLLFKLVKDEVEGATESAGFAEAAVEPAPNLANLGALSVVVATAAVAARGATRVAVAVVATKEVVGTRGFAEEKGVTLGNAVAGLVTSLAPSVVVIVVEVGGTLEATLARPKRGPVLFATAGVSSAAASVFFAPNRGILGAADLVSVEEAEESSKAEESAAATLGLAPKLPVNEKASFSFPSAFVEKPNALLAEEATVLSPSPVAGAAIGLKFANDVFFGAAVSPSFSPASSLVVAAAFLVRDPNDEPLNENPVFFGAGDVSAAEPGWGARSFFSIVVVTIVGVGSTFLVVSEASGVGRIVDGVG